jgi:tetratricopeptide (TPR) repeat protein
MTQRQLRALTILASSLVLPLLAISISVADIVTLTADATTKGASGGLIRGTVISESPAKVEVKLGNTVTAIPTNEIVSISYDNDPASLEQAKVKEAANSLAEAADLYKKAAAEAGTTKPFIAEDAAFGQVRVTTELALTDPAKATEAMTLLETFSRSYKNGRHILPALETLAKLQLAKENFTGLDQTLGQLSKLPGGEDRAGLFRIKVLTRKGNLDQAVSELDKVIAAAPDGSVKKRDAQLAKAESLVGLKKVAEAEALLKSVIKAAPAEDSATQAAAHNALGDCLKAAGRPKEALYAYLHTDLLFSKEKDEHARALAQLAQLWRDPQLNRPDRAEEVMERLKQEYPRSPYLTGSPSPR